MKLILASSSPRRAEILRNAGISFEVFAPEVDETPLAGESAEKMVTRLAESKARAAATQLGKTEDSMAIVGADTCVELDGEVFGKPGDAAHAREMLTALSGRVHQVITGICIVHVPSGATQSAVEVTAVTFAKLGPAEIETYVNTGEPIGKAGAYAIQGYAGRFINRIEGCHFNVVGLPLARLCELLKTTGK